MGLDINEEKRKYTCISRNNRNNSVLLVDTHSFKKVLSYQYLGVNINNKYNVHEKIQERIA